MTKLVDLKSVNAFKSDGVTIIRNVIGEWIETLRAGVAWNLLNPGPSRRSYKGDFGDGEFHSDYCNWQRVSEYKDFIFNSPIGQIAAELMESRSVRLFHEHILIKEEDADVSTPWHQDQPYYCAEGPKTVSFWIPLDHVSRDRTLEFIAGSHRSGEFYQPQFFNGTPLNEGDGLTPVPDISKNRNQFDIRGWAIKPGDVIAFDFRTVHGAPPNTSLTEQRRAFSLRLVGDDARFVRYEGRATSPPFSDVTLEHGALLEGEDFPILYRL